MWAYFERGHGGSVGIGRAAVCQAWTIPRSSLPHTCERSCSTSQLWLSASLTESLRHSSHLTGSAYPSGLLPSPGVMIDAEQPLYEVEQLGLLFKQRWDDVLSLTQAS